jgi:hypothetical protein
VSVVMGVNVAARSPTAAVPTPWSELLQLCRFSARPVCRGRFSLPAPLSSVVLCACTLMCSPRCHKVQAYIQSAGVLRHCNQADVIRMHPPCCCVGPNVLSAVTSGEYEGGAHASLHTTCNHVCSSKKCQTCYLMGATIVAAAKKYALGYFAACWLAGGQAINSG